MSRLYLPSAAAGLCALLVLGCGRNAEPPTEAAPVGPSGSKANPSALATDKVEAAARLKRIGLGLHSCVDRYMNFPAGVQGPNGTIGLSWRVAILPQLGTEEAELYQQFNLKEPWDSEHNKKLLDRMPKVYTSAGNAAAGGKTHVRSFVGPAAFLLGDNGLPRSVAGKPMPGEYAGGRKFPFEFSDGTSNILMVAEAVEAVEWTRPDDLPYSNEAPVPKLGGVFAGGFHGLMADGAVHFFPDTLPDDALRALITVNGNERFSPEVMAILYAPKAPSPVPPTKPSGATKPDRTPSTKPSRAGTSK